MAEAVAAGTDLPLLRRGHPAACTRCRLAEGRTQVVFGSGDPNADLMFVGEAPGFHEDKQGVPFVGQAGELLERLLEGIGLSRSDVYVATCSSAGLRATATRSRTRSRRASRTSSAR